jgi:ABC-type branched-subunit amino acid transport system ATPase component
MSEVILEIDNLTSGYGDLPVLHEVSLSVNKGEIYSILGANGAGKSTLLNTLAGTVKATSGAINFNGVDLAKIKPHKIAENGLVLVPEGRKLFPDCSVEDNLKLGAYHSAARKVAKETIEEMYEMFPRLAERKADGSLHTYVSPFADQTEALVRMANDGARLNNMPLLPLPDREGGMRDIALRPGEATRQNLRIVPTR